MAFQEFWSESPEPCVEELFMELETVKQPAGESLTTKPKKEEHTESRSTSWLGYTSTLFFILAIISLSWPLLLSYNQAEDVSQIPGQPAPVVETKYITKNIEDIRIGERTLGINPQGAQTSEDCEIFKKIKHHGYTLLYLKENQTLSVIELLRPENWLDSEYVQVRRASDEKVLTEAELDKLETADIDDDEDYAFEVWIELPEMGVLGWATLVAIDEEVTIKDGPGNVVTGTFAHVSDNVMDLQLEGQAKPIGCTSNHPFWSVDRQDFVEAGQLMEGEQVQLYNGETKRVVQKLPRPGPEIVYNLEVYAEHVYHVTQDGILVHNTCIRNKHLANQRHPVTNVPFDSEARPLFKPIKRFAKVTIERADPLVWGKKKARDLDIKRANEALAKVLTKELKREVTAKEAWEWVKEHNGVWHHHKDGIMQVVDEKIHQLTGHTGGFSR